MASKWNRNILIPSKCVTTSSNALTKSQLETTITLALCSVAFLKHRSVSTPMRTKLQSKLIDCSKWCSTKQDWDLFLNKVESHHCLERLSFLTLCCKIHCKGIQMNGTDWQVYEISFLLKLQNLSSNYSLKCAV